MNEGSAPQGKLARRLAVAVDQPKDPAATDLHSLRASPHHSLLTKLFPDTLGFIEMTGRGIALRDRDGFGPSSLPAESRLLLASQEAVQIGCVECRSRAAP